MTAHPDAYALAWSGGKDSAHALVRARRMGLDVGWLLNLYDGATGRIRFHGVRRELVAAQAESLGCGLLQRAAGKDDFERAFLGALRELKEAGARGVIFGNVHLADVREWYEVRTRGLGLGHVEPLWGEEPGRLAREAVEAGIRALVVSVDLARGDAEWLGRELDAGLIGAAEALGADPCGERGEYHTFAFDVPGFARPLGVRTGELYEAEGHRLVDLVPDGGSG